VSVNTRTPIARALGSALREAREEQDLSLRSLATRLGRDPGLLSRWETGKRTPRPTDVAQVLTALGVSGDQYDEIVSLAEGKDQTRWVVAVTLPERQQQLSAVLDFESTASTIIEVSPLLIPGLVQTGGYVRAIMSAGGVPPDEIATRVAVRLGRRDTLTRGDPVTHFTALIGEAALRQRIGTERVMAEQLRYLATAAEWKNVEFRIVPFSSGWSPSLEGAFTLLESEQDGAVVHLENRRSGLFLHEPDDVETYREAVDAVMRVALSPDESAKLVTAEITRMEREE
jgi:transcriptional regulator with XRE-family HTH domain